ncbi:MAG: integrase [Cyanobacteria bacterium J06648_11]
MNDLEQRVQILNADLKQRGLKVGVVLRGEFLYLQKTLPPKPDSERERPHQQRIATGLKGLAGLRVIKKRAELLAAACDTNTFRWEDWGWEPKRSKPKTVEDWIAAYEASWRAKGNRKEMTWKKDYFDVFKWLPPNKLLTHSVIVARVEATAPKTRTRDRNCLALQRLAKFAGIPIDLREYMGYEQSQVQPRLLPGDDQITAWRETIANPAWQYVYGLIACYGLRPHEIFHLKFDEFPILEVGENTKTGWRYVTPLYPEWAEVWHLDRYNLPAVSTSGDNRKLGEKVTGFFRRADFRRKPSDKRRVTAYTLRHCYARRAFEFDYAPDEGAMMMGHSQLVHEKVYRAWMRKGVYLQKFERLMQRGDRPKPPELIAPD